MPHAQAEITINRPIEEVFAYVADPRNSPHWQPAVVEVTHGPDGDMGVGATYMTLASFLGRRFTTAVEVTEYQRPTTYGWRVTHGPVHARRHFDLESVDGQTRVRMRLEADGLHVLRFAEDLIIRAGQRHEQHSLENLKDILETHGPDHPR